MLFLFLAILEDSGYLARAAFLMDRLLSKVGLHGKSFIPLLSSFACAIPGIMATRTIENRKDRLATIFIAPFMSCTRAAAGLRAADRHLLRRATAPALKGGIMLALYAPGHHRRRGDRVGLQALAHSKARPQAFILEMPTYKVPQASQVARRSGPTLSVPRQGGDDHLLPERDPVGDDVLPAAAGGASSRSMRRGPDYRARDLANDSAQMHGCRNDRQLDPR